MNRLGLALIVALVACAPSAVDYEEVRVTTDPAVPNMCAFLGEVTGGGDPLANAGQSTGALPIDSSAQLDPIVSRRQATADFGGNTVVIVSSGDSGIGASILGEAYDCRSYNPQ